MGGCMIEADSDDGWICGELLVTLWERKWGLFLICSVAQNSIIIIIPCDNNHMEFGISTQCLKWGCNVVFLMYHPYYSHTTPLCWKKKLGQSLVLNLFGVFCCFFWWNCECRTSAWDLRIKVPSRKANMVFSQECERTTLDAPRRKLRQEPLSGFGCDINRKPLQLVKTSGSRSAFATKSVQLCTLLTTRLRVLIIGKHKKSVLISRLASDRAQLSKCSLWALKTSGCGKDPLSCLSGISPHPAKRKGSLHQALPPGHMSLARPTLSPLIKRAV